MTYTIDDLIYDVERREITDSDIKAMEKRLQEAEYVKEKNPPWDWYHQIIG